MIMILVQFLFVGILLNLAVSIPLLKAKQDENRIAYNSHQDPHLWERSGKFQGDMVLTPEQQAYLHKSNEQRNGVIDPTLRWPDRTIPYSISSSFSSKERAFIENTLQEDFGRSCVNVVPRTDQGDYVYITAENDGCWSDVGRVGGRQELNLDRDGCLDYSTVVHEFLHAAGFEHQQSATERDDYVTIHWENIEPGAEANFKKFGSNVISSFGQPYDYGSVMHYDAYAFSKNDEKTIVPKQNVEIGTAPRLSTIDIAKLNIMYGC